MLWLVIPNSCYGSIILLMSVPTRPVLPYVPFSLSSSSRFLLSPSNCFFPSVYLHFSHPVINVARRVSEWGSALCEPGRECVSERVCVCMRTFVLGIVTGWATP
jgi:hypothetical protein